MSDTPQPLQPQAVWAAVSATLREQVSADTFDRWFRDTILISVDETQFTLKVPNKIYQLWIETNYLHLLQAAVVLAVGSARTVRFSYADEGSTHATGLEAGVPMQIGSVSRIDDLNLEEAPSVSAHGLNARNTFESFVVGANSQFAHAACAAVGAAPGKTYNPLFYYGGVGLGKTHLMHAIGHTILGRKRAAKVQYITSERFTNEFIDAIQSNSLVRFRKRYRSVDVLLIDDIQFLAGKERSQEEFFHTFNALFDGHKQIVLSSDRPPSEIANLEARLVSRFEWGMTAELSPPDVETRMAILQKKAQSMNVRMSSPVLTFLAEHIRTNVRRLEGALMRVASFASLNDGGMPSTERMEHLLKDLLQEEARRTITIDQIQRRVADHFDVRLADMTSKRRPANIAWPRQVAMYLARENTKASLCEIGEAFGGRDHGTVLHAHRQVKSKIKGDERTRQVVALLDDLLHR